MASGNAIDEQYKDVWATQEAMLDARKRDKAAEVNPQSTETEDFDPNDVIIPPTSIGRGGFDDVPGTLRPPMDDDSEDDDLYDF